MIYHSLCEKYNTKIVIIFCYLIKNYEKDEMKKGAHVTLFGPNSIIGKFRAFFTAPIDKKLSAKHPTKMMGTSPAVQLYQRIKNFFGPVTRPLMGIIADFKKTSTFATDLSLVAYNLAGNTFVLFKTNTSPLLK